MQKKAIILFSGGLDSTTCLALALSEGYTCYAMSFIYGQKHSVELERAKQIAVSYKVMEHECFTLPLGEIRGSSLTDDKIDVKDYQNGGGIPNTYVPARNTIFLSMALAWAEVIGAYDIFLGANNVDYSGYPDCRPEYFRAFEKVSQLATKVGVEENQQFKIHTPLLYMSKAEIIQLGIQLGIDYSQTLSCYRPDVKGRACGKCDSCVYRKKGFAEAGVVDPTLYV